MFVLGPVVFVKQFVSMAMTSGFGVGYRNSSCFVYALEPAFPWRTTLLLHRTIYLLRTIKASCSEIKRQKVHERLKTVSSHEESVILQVQPSATLYPGFFP